MPSRLTVVLVSLLVATPAVIFWLWLVIVPARVAELCPQECICDTGGYHVDCSDLSLNNIPLIFPTDVRTLLLDFNNITSLEKESFLYRGLTELRSLSAAFCNLETIQLRAFSGLTNLKYLVLWGNKISEIIPGTFEKMSHLQFLILPYNRIEHLEVDVLRGLDNIIWIFIHSSVICHTTGPQPRPKRFLHLMRSRASSFK
jgi:hypothetical protein